MELDGPQKVVHQHATAINADSAMLVERSSYSSGSEDAPVCWICLESSGPLIFPCKCPRQAHTRCLARWQLQSAGTKRERRCDFCDAELPDWKTALTPTCGASAPAVMNVNFDGRTYSFEVKPGPDGYHLFTESIRRAFNLPDDSELNITFTCDEPTAPDNGSLLTLQGPGAYDAAVHCASVSAARRMVSGASTPSHTPTRTTSMASEGAGPFTPRSPHSLARATSFATPETHEAALGAPNSVEPSPSAKRRLSGFGRRLRTAIGELLPAAARS